MSERLSAEERAATLWNHLPVEVQQAWSQYHNEGFCSEIGMMIHDAEKAAAEVERERYDQMLVEAGREVIYTKQEMQELTLPITDKSICSRGHPRACLVEVWDEEDAALSDTKPRGAHCSACTQLEVELKPLREALRQALGGGVVGEALRRNRG